MPSSFRPWRRPWLMPVVAAVAVAMLPAGSAGAAPVAVAAPAPAASAVAASQCGPLDITFVVDDTGSMGGAIANIKSGIGAIISDVVTLSGNDYKLGLVTFKDNVTVVNDLAALNQAAVTTSVNALAATGGGNEPEASDEALRTAINNLAAGPPRPQVGNFFGTWRSNATKMIILVTDARPGGFDDNFTAADQTEANNRAHEAQNWIKISPVYVPTNSSLTPTIQPIMQNYATVTGGVMTTTAANGTGTAGAIQQALRNCRRTDVFIHDHPADVGTQPHGLNPIWTSPDITVCNSPVPCAGTNPIVGGTSYVFVKLNNPGPYGSGTGTGTLHLYYTAQGGAANWPADWTLINSATGVTVPPGTTTVMIPWVGVPGPGHFCLLGRWISATDPMGFPEGLNTLTNTRNNNNIGWRNVDSVQVHPGQPTTHPFTVGNAGTDVLRTDLVLNAPFVQDGGRLVVDLGKDLAERWRQSGQKGVGVAPVGETQVAIVDPNDARIQGLTVNPKERFTTNLTFDADAAGVGKQWVVRMFQADQDVDLGGVEFQVTVE